MMKNTINITGNNQTFSYLLEYINNDYVEDNLVDNYTEWNRCELNRNTIHLISNNKDKNSCNYFRHNNDWYSMDSINMHTDYLPRKTHTSKIRVYIPNHNVSTYTRGIKYAVTANTWINGYKIDFGTFIFNSTETLAISEGIIKRGNNEYHEYIEFDIIDPFDLIYTDEENLPNNWGNFRESVCNEPKEINNTGSILNVSLYIVKDTDDNNEKRYIMDSEYYGGITSFNISKESEYLNIKLSKSLDPIGLKFELNTNSVYDWLLSYIKETYNIATKRNNIYFELIIQNEDTAIVGPQIIYSPTESYGYAIQNVSLSILMENKNIKTFFENWNNFEEGWSFVGSLNICGYEDETIYFISNKLPITQELFSQFIDNGSEKIIDIENMNINTYNIVNKIENKIVQIERPNNSKSNIMQPVFFRVKDTETLTIHPIVTENVCINLNDYKSKVEKFILQIEGCNFEQIGSTNYGILFKINAKSLPLKVTAGTYYILNEDLELVTTGKYNCAL